MILLYAHSGIRYLILLAGVLALGYALWGLARRRPYDATMRRLAMAFAGLIHLQIVLGVGLLFTGRFAPAVTGHILLMVLAAAAAQVVPSIMRRRPPEERTWMPHVVSTAAALVLIAVGILSIGRPILGSGL